MPLVTTETPYACKFSTSHCSVNVALRSALLFPVNHQAIRESIAELGFLKTRAVKVPCMHLSSLPRFATTRLLNSRCVTATSVRTGDFCKPRAVCDLPRRDRLSRPSSSVHRRQVLTTSFLSLLPRWLPFSTMSAKAAFELPQGDKWWSDETVAVVTGGEWL